MLFSSIPSKNTTGAHERLRLACKNGEIILENDDAVTRAVSQILKVLDNIHKRDDLSLTFETWSSFIKLRKKDTDSMVQCDDGIEDIEVRGCRVGRSRPFFSCHWTV